MALIEIRAEPGLLRELLEVLRALIARLERIADGIDRAYPPAPPLEARKKMKPHGPDDMVQFDPEEEWLKEQEEEARKL